MGGVAGNKLRAKPLRCEGGRVGKDMRGRGGGEGIYIGAVMKKLRGKGK